MSNVSLWAQGVVIAVIIGTIIEMILPKSSNSKYVKVVIGIFILFSIVVPVIGKINNGKIDTNSIIKLDDYEVDTLSSSISSDSIEEQRNNQIVNIYKENLQIDIQSKVQLKGFRAENILVDVSNDDNYTIKKIEMKITQKDEEYINEKKVVSIVDNIENIKINLSGKQEQAQQTDSILTSKEKSDLIKYLSDTYQIKKENILIL